MGIAVMLFVVEVFSTIFQYIFCENTLTRRVEKKHIDLIIWGGYFVVFNLATYVVADSVWLNMLIFFGAFFLTIRALYINSLKTLLVTSVFMYLAGMISELLAFYVNSLLPWSFGKDTELVCAVMARLIWSCVVKLVSLLVKMRKSVELELLDWMEVFMVPFGSILILLALFQMDPFTGQLFQFMAVFMVLAINIFTYFLYDKSKETLEKRLREEILEKQCEYYVRQNRESQEWWEELRRFRHDMKQRYLLEKTFLESGNYKELERYYDESLDFISRKNVISDTGNLYVDSIINYKADAAGKLGIEFITDVSVPRDMELDAEDLGICLGNLLDNAIEAASQLTEDKAVRIKIRMDKKNLFINITNKYKNIHKEDGKYLTSKTNSRNHGLGLLIIRQIVDKYEGRLEINDANGVFEVSVLLYDFIKFFY